MGRDIAEGPPHLYARVCKRVARELERYGERAAAPSLPPECPYTLDQILADGWYPEPAGPTALP